MTTTAISVKNISKKYKFYKNPRHRLAEWCSGGLWTGSTEFWALDDISFELPKGQCLGVIGHNGSGKSTLLKIISRALYQTSGEFNVNGRLVSLLELGTGFNPELSGIENIYSSSRLLGFPEDYITQRLPEMIEFAEIGEFVDRPVRTYSSGMFVRLAFSLYAHLDPEIYIVDEALAVGDIFFQQKCFNKFREMREQGNTVLLVSHDMGAISQLCDRAILLEKGKLVFDGDPQAAANRYHTGAEDNVIETIPKEEVEEVKEEPEEKNISTFEMERASLPPDFPQPPHSQSEFLNQAINLQGKDRHGDGAATILGVNVVNQNGESSLDFNYGESMFIQTYFKANKTIGTISNGLHLYDRTGILIFAEGAINEGVNFGPMDTGDSTCSILKIPLNIHPGEYTVTLGLSCPTLEDNVLSGEIFDRIVGAFNFQVHFTWNQASDLAPFHGITDLNMGVGKCSFKK